MNRIIIDGDQARLYGLPKAIPTEQVGFSKIGFEFSSEWDGMTKIAQFMQGENKYNVAVENNECTCPNELVKGWVSVRVRGYSETTVIATANEILLPVSTGFQSGGIPPIPPTPDLYQQLLKSIQDQIGDLDDLTTEEKDNLVAAINEAAASGGADWAQNDPTAKDYVKNRPGGYDIVTPERTISEYQLQGNTFDVPIELSEPLVVGRSYRFTFYETADQSNIIFDGEVVAETTDVPTVGIVVIMPGYGEIFQPETYPENPAIYQGNKYYPFGYLKLVTPSNTQIVKIPDKYIINSDFIIAATVISEDSKTVTLDKTFDQIREAIRDGKRAVIHIANTSESENGFSSLQLLINDSRMIVFSGTEIMGIDYSVTITIVINKKNEVRLFNGFAPVMRPEGTFPQLEMFQAPTRDMQIATKKYVDDKECILKSTTPNSTKKFKITVDDSGTITTMEV